MAAVGCGNERDEVGLGEMGNERVRVFWYLTYVVIIFIYFLIF